MTRPRFRSMISSAAEVLLAHFQNGGGREFGLFALRLFPGFLYGSNKLFANILFHIILRLH